MGFSVTEAATDINSQKPDGKGGDLVTLSDNTRLDLLGISHVTASDFV